MMAERYTKTMKFAGQTANTDLFFRQAEKSEPICDTFTKNDGIIFDWVKLFI
ncbi:MAG: hypothetical protein AB7V25_13515 [Mangrovibacterium sp.]